MDWDKKKLHIWVFNFFFSNSIIGLTINHFNQWQHLKTKIASKVLLARRDAALPKINCKHANKGEIPVE